VTEQLFLRGARRVIPLEHNYLYKKKGNRYLKKRRKKLTTCIIGIVCKDGVVLAGDRKVLRGAECSFEPKISEPFPGFVVGASGISGLMDKFLYQTHVFLNSAEAKEKKYGWKEFLETLEDITYSLFKRYDARLSVNEQVEVGACDFDVLIGCKEYQNKAKLYRLYRNGFSSEIKRFDIIGHGYPYALPFVKALYKDELNMTQAVKISGFALKLIDEANIDLTVGGEPQIWMIPDDEKQQPRELAKEEVNKILGTASYPTSVLEAILKI
jgi:20S proteasome alpha/beta subunit